MSTWSLRSGFLRSLQLFPDRPALEVDGEAWSYRRLYERAVQLAATLETRWCDEVPLTGLLTYRSASAFAGVLGALFRGHGYVPLNPTYPVERTRKMLDRSGCSSIIVDRAGSEQLPELLEGVDRPLLLILPDSEEADSLARSYPDHQVIVGGQLEKTNGWRPSEVAADAVAYLLFTSGSTGSPKGVAVSHRNVTHFIDFVVKRYEIDENDRLTQMYDMTFDLSVFDMFAAWERGACVCCPSLHQRNLPAKFINESQATIWFSVPSTGLLLEKLRLLRPGAYPRLRLSLFCGEPLTAALADVWARAAPNSLVENLYGPTELTIACTFYRWDPERGPAEVENGIVPIGKPFPGMRVLVADDSLNEVVVGNVGELLMSGPQVALGYWNDSEKTAKAFVRPFANGDVYYRTGDLVRRTEGSKPLCYQGRIDHQIKIQGYRVELGEIEAAVRKAAGVAIAVAVGWPITSAGADGIVVFVEGSEGLAGATEQLREHLPHYMVPRDIRSLPRLPLTPNGKVDRRALVGILESE